MEWLEPTARAWPPELYSRNVCDITRSILDSNHSVAETFNKGNKAAGATIGIAVRVECNEVALAFLEHTHEIVVTVPERFEH